MHTTPEWSHDFKLSPETTFPTRHPFESNLSIEGNHLDSSGKYAVWYNFCIKKNYTNNKSVSHYLLHPPSSDTNITKK